MTAIVRTAGLLALLLLAHAGAHAATPREIDAAKKKGADWLRAKYKAAPTNFGGDANGPGPMCMAGLAMLEAGVPGDDPAVKAVTAAVREAGWTQTRTYPASLCLLYLDRYGDPADVPLIQVLGVRLLMGQTSNGGWSYDFTIPGLSADEITALKAMKPPPVGKLHPDVEKYAQALIAHRAKTALAPADDNSNTQFAVIAVWVSRKHGVPVNDALALIERRFRASQSPQTGGWPYSGVAAGQGSPAMYCAGLIGLATGIARREELRTKPEPKPEPKKSDPGPEPKKSDDPFFNPKVPEPKAEPKKTPPPRAADALDVATRAAFIGLGAALADMAREGRGALAIKDGSHGHGDLYFLWSVERVGVLYGVEKIGGVNWYEAGAHALVFAQAPDGSWADKGYAGDVNTAFAVLFLCKSNLARDLSGKVQNDTTTEMRAGLPTGTAPKAPDGSGTVTKDPLDVPTFVPGPAGSEAATLAAELVRSGDRDWAKVLTKIRDAKGAVNTQALVGAVARLDGDRRREAREALAERLTRMNAETLRAMAKNEESELRRAAVLAMAMKDDKAHLPDLVAALLDDEDLVVRAARAGLRSLTGQDFGPAPNATAGEKKLVVQSWQDWTGKQKK
ncbi:HEAT repeat domain-containing protein [Gemmata sp.]|uniref:HEAT repeat domain-containing protein n=1 Tax=Gemmata sp. TaxID=1914242 RepID=UPI003F700867